MRGSSMKMDGTKLSGEKISLNLGRNMKTGERGE